MTSIRAKKTGKTGFGKALNVARASCKVIVVGEGDARTADREAKVFTVTVKSDENETYQFNHSNAVEFLGFLGIDGMEACRDAEDFGKVEYHFDHETIPVVIEYHTDSRV